MNKYLELKSIDCCYTMVVPNEFGENITINDYVSVLKRNSVEPVMMNVKKIINESSEIIGERNFTLAKVSFKEISAINKNNDLKKSILNFCKAYILNGKLAMIIVDIDLAVDLKRVQIKYTADIRIDFRQFAKDLSSKFKIKIEFRQIGVRDKARIIGGIGPCGFEICCKKYLEEIQPINIGMAKNQNIALNPTRINGVCGRLKCCLKYENESYSIMKKDMPKLGSFIEDENGKGKIIDVNVFDRTTKVMYSDRTIINKKYDN